MIDPVEEAKIKIENAGHDAYALPSDFGAAQEMATWYASVIKDIGPMEIWWAIIAEHHDALNLGRQGDERLTYEQAATSLMWRASCEWDV